jgi:predicted TIM-barrel fold metal-dependent hydrolase
MARNGFRLIDAEMHVMEPVDLWQRYIDPEFKDRAPRRLSERKWDIRTLVEGEVMAQIPGGDWPALSAAEETAMATRYAEEIARDFDPASQVKAMDKEGLDLAILYPTAGMYATAFTHMEPRFAAAVCRAYNDWLYDYIQAADPKRMFGAACVSPHDIERAVAETRRAIGELGMKAIFLRPNIYNDKPWHDPLYDPLWAACQELNVPVGFHETTGSRMKAAGTDRFQALGIAHISTHPMEQMLACMDIIMGGVLERFPKLRVAFLEAQCGWLPFWLDRMDEHYEWREPMAR